MRADLHVHSNASDGTDPPAEVMRRAARAGLDAVALTDHDTVAGLAEARVGLPDGLTLVPGMELSCRLNAPEPPGQPSRGIPGGSEGSSPRGQPSRGVPVGSEGSSPRGQPSRGVPGGSEGSSPRDQQSLHLLAYLFDPGTPELAEQTRRIRDDRVLRAQAMVRRLAELGVAITWDQVAALAGQGVVGRPHIARAMAASGAIAEPGEAFTRDWIGHGGRAYVGRYALDPVHAVRLIRAAGGAAVLAHPRAGRQGWVVSDEQITSLAAAGLAGVEVFHPDQSAAARAALLGLARDLGLVATGGSDDHGSLTGHRIGSQTTPAGDYANLISKATGAKPISGD
jgi:3',5'-nucleoside bisphosphate phosphatase